MSNCLYFGEYIDLLKNTKDLNVLTFPISGDLVEDYVEVSKNGIHLLINNEFKEVCPVSIVSGNKEMGDAIAVDCTFEDYTNILKALLKVNVGDKLNN